MTERTKGVPQLAEWFQQLGEARTGTLNRDLKGTSSFCHTKALFTYIEPSLVNTLMEQSIEGVSKYEQTLTSRPDTI